MVKTIINHVESNNDISLVEMLANKIWHEHYLPIIGREQVTYMLGKFQSTPAIKRQIQDGANYHLVYEQNHPVGYFCYHYENDSLFLSKIYVAKEVRGKGIGKRALDFIVEQAKLQSARAIRLTVNKFNLGTIAAYKQLGFETIDSIVKDIGGGFVMDDYVMEKPLTKKAV
ncbi:GNAT family N-acetyltransferase [Kangiella taiwanensis]|uniref:GNAT family N-acetyltransferase n=1 Tax=Kangiella taiwanensis TaxID=1079179 RepID=A0ABP8I5Q6_9GAMM|nr:GNAT family N-acetyltransferase [Kangiella taiwanensis]